MKRFVLAIATLMACAGVFAQTQPAPAATVQKPEDYVKFKETLHDFGKIKQGAPVTHDFAFSNISDKPIVIESAIASCGCTTPVKPEAPVAKGKNDKITAGFNAAAAGPFTKTITVKLAGVDKPIELKITGEVLTADNYAKYQQEKGAKKG